ncbi:hypothetical protein FIBSPDRAFT_1005148 [Athelia psychrophila]|uniref:Uncharacterized protein n=1 Tax=Athelia psychrophila TaxID=1759441 RepID=A0A167VVF7_9AGAM|nr:hypothetical protein FIBSPDRAFT_1005148 [Fibularhizoctonia sp. CBS 109695]
MGCSWRAVAMTRKFEAVGLEYARPRTKMPLLSLRYANFRTEMRSILGLKYAKNPDKDRVLPSIHMQGHVALQFYQAASLLPKTARLREEQHQSLEARHPNHAVKYCEMNGLGDEHFKFRRRLVFTTYGTSGGMVNNVQNGNVTMGDQIDYIEHAVYNIYHIAPSVEVLERFRTMYPPGSPPDETTTTTTTIPMVSPSLGVTRTHSPSASGPPTNQIAMNGFTVTFDSSASANNSLIEIGVIVDIMDALIENPSLRHSVTLPVTLACRGLYVRLS